MVASKPRLDGFTEEDPLGDLYDYVVPSRPEPSRSRKRRRGTRVPWRLQVVSDFPDRIPVTSAEVDIFEAHFADFFEELFAPKT